jgi:hypothetical protein
MGMAFKSLLKGEKYNNGDKKTGSQSDPVGKLLKKENKRI